MEEERKEYELSMQVLRELEEVVHDGNNIIGALKAGTASGMLRTKGTDLHEDFANIDWSADILSGMFKELLNVAKGIKISAEPIPVRPSIEKGIALAALKISEHGIDVKTSIGGNILPVRHHLMSIARVINNLLINSADEMPAGGRIRIDARETRIKAPLPTEFEVMPAGRYVRIEVSDTGPGISPGIRKKMFDFYASTKEHKGSGIGLAYVRKVVEAHAGFIQVETRKDHGTSIIIYLPYDAAEARVGVAVITDEGTKPGIRRILVVDDEKVIQRTTRKILEQVGFEVSTAERGEEALNLLEGNDFDLIITDYKVPGIGGKELIERMRAKDRRIPIFCMSGLSLGELEEQGLVQATFQKPFSYEKLLSRIEALGTTPDKDT
jgi:CheY-like chemotaxis protein